MKSVYASLAAVLTCTAAFAESPLTHNCRSHFDTGEVLLFLSSPTKRDEFLAIAADPTKEPAIYSKLWAPNGSRAIGLDWGAIRFERNTDTVEIARAIEADATLRGRGLTSALANTATVCFATPPAAKQVFVTEYHNRVLDHYFLSSSAGENAAIDSGFAGPGWARTGESFIAIEPGACYSSYPVFRFYTFGANSHFYTADPGECGFLRRNDPAWLFEGDAFGAHLPVNGSCPGRTKPVYRLYNNRWMFNDSNHRFVTRLDLYQQMQERGWKGEGLAFCVAEQAGDYRTPP
jgi:hypothetical protein